MLKRNKTLNDPSFNLVEFLVIGAIIMFALAGCSSGGDGDDSMADISAPVLEGVFVDSPVEGLHYETATQSGITDSEGRFRYLKGESITFSIGDAILGSAAAQEYMTPVHLVDGASDETHPTVTNMGRFMQSLDVDGNPENGITISSQINNEVMGREINFNLGVTEFENHHDVTALFDTLNGMGAFSNGTHHMLIPVEQAQQHMRGYLSPGENSDDMGHNTDMDNMVPGNDTEDHNQIPVDDTGYDTEDHTQVPADDDFANCYVQQYLTSIILD